MPGFILKTTSVIATLCFTAVSASASADLSPEIAAEIERSAERIGETMVDQSKDSDDIQKVLTFYVENEVAKALHPESPEAPLPPEDSKAVSSIVGNVMLKLHIVSRVKPTPMPEPVTPPARPTRPDHPVTPPAPPGTGGQPVIVWVLVPQPQPMPLPAPWPAPAFGPMPQFGGAPPTIHIKHGWFGHPDKVWYSRH